MYEDPRFYRPDDTCKPWKWDTQTGQPGAAGGPPNTYGHFTVPHDHAGVISTALIIGTNLPSGQDKNNRRVLLVEADAESDQQDQAISLNGGIVEVTEIGSDGLIYPGFANPIVAGRRPVYVRLKPGKTYSPVCPGSLGSDDQLIAFFGWIWPIHDRSRQVDPRIWNPDETCDPLLLSCHHNRPVGQPVLLQAGSFRIPAGKLGVLRYLTIGGIAIHPKATNTWWITQNTDRLSINSPAVTGAMLDAEEYVEGKVVTKGFTNGKGIGRGREICFLLSERWELWRLAATLQPLGFEAFGWIFDPALPAAPPPYPRFDFFPVAGAWLD